MRLTRRENQIVTLLRRDPTIGSAGIAKAINTSRAAVNVHLSNLGKKGIILGRGYILSEQPGVVVVGGSNIDVKARAAVRATPGTSNPGHGSMSPGGVGRNVAENLARLGARTYLVSVIGRDAMGETLIARTSAAGVRVDYVHRTDLPTGTYTALLDVDGELVMAVADMGAIGELGPEQLSDARDVITSAAFLVLDGNLTSDTLTHALALAVAGGVRTILEPVSVPKARRLGEHITPTHPLYAVTPNREELSALSDLPARTDKQLQRAAARLHKRGVEHVWVRLGARGSMVSSATGELIFLPAIATRIEDVTGAGDSMLAAFCFALLEGREPIDAARYGHAAAGLTIASPHTVRPDLSPELVQAALDRSRDDRLDHCTEEH